MSVFLHPIFYRSNVQLKGKEKGLVGGNKMTNPHPKGSKLEQHDWYFLTGMLSVQSLTFFVTHKGVGDPE